MEAEIIEIINFNCNTMLQHATGYIIPIFGIVAAFVNIFSGFVFYKSKKFTKKPIVRYLAANSITDGTLFILYSTAYQLSCKKSIIFTFSYQLFLYITLYLVRVFGMVSTLINIKIAVDRYLFLKSYFLSYFNKPIKRNLFVIILFSLAFYSPKFFFTKIQNIDGFILNSTDLNLTSRNFIIYFTEMVQKEKGIQLFILFFLQFVMLMFLVIMICMNTLIYVNLVKPFRNSVKFKVIYYKNSKIKMMQNEGLLVRSNEKCARENYRLTLLVIWISFLFIADQIFICIGNTAYILSGRRSTSTYALLGITFIGRTVCSFLNSVVYFTYNREYKRFIQSKLKPNCIKKQ